MTCSPNNSYPPAIPFEFYRLLDQHFQRIIGKPVKHLGKDPEGLDCAGLIIWWYPIVGLPIEVPLRAAFYPKDYWKTGADFTYLREILRQFAAIPETQAAKGDLVLFKPPNGLETVGHTGIVYDAQKKLFVSAEGKRVRTMCWTDTFWRTKFFGIVRHRMTERLVLRRQDLPESLKI